ncbi:MULTISPECIES: hypothetical protein [Virgibacillus]|uniref:Uncharacterized protein n=1 Tax=Virgibacillus kapii TaxID=1638645 RepID=A0ABQ2DEB6_9BACI|nr:MULTISPECIES: hypothetical protein [Virgibacillus]EQB38226.1 hypothetical protein M948_06520 [Virgibacillus sp. CM-4]GGJ52919.1 hypothetical protein GCM10007111_13910 [Virgibacillus kapii]
MGHVSFSLFIRENKELVRLKQLSNEISRFSVAKRERGGATEQEGVLV